MRLRKWRSIGLDGLDGLDSFGWMTELDKLALRLTVTGHQWIEAWQTFGGVRHSSSIPVIFLYSF